jgi:hypothetical protein
MKHARNRLPDRRPNETVELVFNGTPYAVTVGYFLATGRVGEVFTHGAKVGSAMDAILDDTCVLISLLLQHGIEPKSLASSMGRHGDGQAPASIVGALADLLADIEVPKAADEVVRDAHVVDGDLPHPGSATGMSGGES